MTISCLILKNYYDVLSLISDENLMEKIETKIQKNKLKTSNLLKNTKENLFWILFYHSVKTELILKKLTDKKFYERIKQIAVYVSKTEAKESYQMVKLLLKKNKTPEEIQFIKEQLADLGRMSALWWVGILPGGSLIAVILAKLGIDFSPSALKEVKNLQNNPEKWHKK